MDIWIPWFSNCSLKCLTIKKQRKHESSVFHYYFYCFELWDSTDAHVFSIEMFKEIYRKRTCQNIWNSENIPKTNDISTIRPHKINVKTIQFFIFLENIITSKFLWKLIKKHEISEYYLKPTKKQHFDPPEFI